MYLYTLWSSLNRRKLQVVVCTHLWINVHARETQPVGDNADLRVPTSVRAVTQTEVSAQIKNTDFLPPLPPSVNKERL